MLERIEGHDASAAAMRDGRRETRRGNAARCAGFQNANASVGANQVVEKREEGKGRCVVNDCRLAVGHPVEGPGQSLDAAAADPRTQCREKARIVVAVRRCDEWTGDARVASLRGGVFLLRPCGEVNGV